MSELSFENLEGLKPGDAFRCYADNVAIRLEPETTETTSGIAIVRQKGPGARYSRTAVVIASGPGYRTRAGVFVENQVKAGDRVVVDAHAGQDYSMDLSAPRQNKGPELEELMGSRGAYRIVRHDELLAIVDGDVRVGE